MYEKYVRIFKYNVIELDWQDIDNVTGTQDPQTPLSIYSQSHVNAQKMWHYCIVEDPKHFIALDSLSKAGKLIHF